MSQQHELYNLLGGEAAIDATVEEFYKRVLADPLLKPFFAKTDMKLQRNRQKQFFNHVLGGKAYYGKNMRLAHKGMGLTDKHFNATAGHLIGALLSLGVEQKLVDQVIAIVETTRADVTERPVQSENLIFGVTQTNFLITASVALAAIAIGTIIFQKTQQK